MDYKSVFASAEMLAKVKGFGFISLRCYADMRQRKHRNNHLPCDPDLIRTSAVDSKANSCNNNNNNIYLPSKN